MFLWQLQDNMCNIDIHYLVSGNWAIKTGFQKMEEMSFSAVIGDQ